MNRPLLLVCGCPRSGTSALATVLAGHPEVALGMERYNRIIAAGALRPEHLEEERFFGIRPGDTWYDSLDKFRRHYAAQRVKYATARYVGDKMPRAYEHYLALAAAFPDLRSIFLVRGITAVARSYEGRRARGVQWPANWGARMAVKHWNASLRATLDWAQRLPILPVRFEEFVASDEALHRIAAFLGIEAAPLVEARAAHDARRRARPREPNPELSAEDLAFIEAEHDREALAAVTALAQRPPDYAGAWRTLGGAAPIARRHSRDDQDPAGPEVPQPPKARVSLPAPALLSGRAGEAILFLGSAATAGHGIPRPFAAQLAEMLGVPAVNGGFDGARPDIFLREPALQAWLDQAGAVVVEAVPARSYATEIFIPGDHHVDFGLRGTPRPDAGAVVGDGPRAARFVDQVYRAALREEAMADALRRARMACLSAWVSDMKRLAARTSGRNVLLYLSPRRPEFTSRPSSLRSWSGGYPHHVDRAALEVLRPHFRAVIELVFASGQAEEAERGGTAGASAKAATGNCPPQAVHDEAARRLEPVLRALLAGAAELPSVPAPPAYPARDGGRHGRRGPGAGLLGRRAAG